MRQAKTTAFVALDDGSEALIKGGQPYNDDEDVVRLHPDLFEDITAGPRQSPVFLAENEPEPAPEPSEFSPTHVGAEGDDQGDEGDGDQGNEPEPTPNQTRPGRPGTRAGRTGKDR